MNEPETSVATRLALDLEQGAELVDVGGFDIDADEGLTKLAQFQLADARSYVLRLAEAGLLAGATRLRFDIDVSSLKVAFDRSPDPAVASSTVLERLTSVLVSRSPPEPVAQEGLPRTGLVQLAVAALAISRLEPRYFAIESVAADRRGHRRVYAPEPKSEVLVDAEPGMRIYVVERIDLGNLIDGLAGLRHEQKLLLQHCQFCRTPVYVNGRRISGKPVLSRPLIAESVVDPQAGVIGVAGIVANSGPSAQLHLLSHGLLIESQILGDADPGFVAAIDRPLIRDLSQSAVVHSPELEATLAAVSAVHARLMSQIARARTRQHAQASPFTKLPDPAKGAIVAFSVTLILLAPLVIVLAVPFGMIAAASALMAAIVYLVLIF